ncbi:MAG: hypothetical protein QOI98_2398 [Solirubrobacteraceae bacterium]|nr:hypothetical protein [Solirubrobacteraceae bacterium]
MKQIAEAAPVRAMRGRGFAVAAAVACAAVLAGCGLGAGSAPTGVQLAVTDDFGARPVAAFAHPKLKGEETVIRLLSRNARVRTRYGGGFVQSIDGLAGGQRGGRPIDWFYYVNGIEAPRGAADTKVRAGDRVWWDRHDWGRANRIPAVVGSFPEPFRHGTGGRRLPVRVECAPPTTPACGQVSDRLVALGVPAARGGLGTSAAQKTLRVLVGTWQALRLDPAALPLEHGPAASGVFVRMDAGGKAVSLLDARGRVTRVLRAGTGLVAATRFEEAQPTWFVTGSDARGLDSAVRALDASALTGHFALVVSQDRGIPVPDVTP